MTERLDQKYKLEDFNLGDVIIIKYSVYEEHSLQEESNTLLTILEINEGGVNPLYAIPLDHSNPAIDCFAPDEVQGIYTKEKHPEYYLGGF